MSKRGYISRYLLIIKKLKSKPFSTYEELQSFIENQFEYLQSQDDSLNIGFSKRTLQRDLKEIREVFGIDIEYSKAQKGYFISQSETENMNFQRMIEAFDMFHSLNMAKDFTSFIHLEKRRPQGTENLSGFIHAIQNRFYVKFEYQKFWDENPTHRLVAPYALKEFKNRWYILAQDQNDKRIKSFGLDRIYNLEITKDKFLYPHHYSVEDEYRYCFGIVSNTPEAPEEIILSFNPVQGKYIKTLPLHPTQEILKDNEKETRIKLTLKLTYDLLMEILSFGSNVKVLQPKSLIEQVKKAHKEALEQY